MDIYAKRYIIPDLLFQIRWLSILNIVSSLSCHLTSKRKPFKCKNTDDRGIQPYHLLSLTTVKRFREPKLKSLIGPSPAIKLARISYLFDNYPSGKVK